ncbi:Hypothetical predicted protein [Mytilus galloprovincialis]|uniref:Uncharacterized protein n=1 Tax=Mytilus galloprovincialis TaxID=29158 RepID=A0A8B6BHE8_MYTGA|nr:Hypothetical predicted protein [Mytilus galloprovincialis]
MMVRKDIVLSRLIKYNDSPFQFLSWKETFKDVMKELSVTPSEELDLLIKWLGPDSARQAESIKAASASDHVGGLHKIWDRLDVRYGSPELIEQCLKTKLANFPKLTNTAKDYERLYELYDILCEIQFVKNNPQYSQVLAYYDSSTGVNQIVNCLPHNLQEKWSTEAIKYKKRHSMLYPPFSFFVDFTYDMAKWRTDPSFQFAPQTNKTSNPANVESAVDLMKRTQKALVDGGGLRLHKIVSNSKAVLQSFPSEDLSSDLKDLDLGSETPPVQRSIGLSWDISVDQFTFKVSSEKKPYTRRGALSVINSIFDPIGVCVSNYNEWKTNSPRDDVRICDLQIGMKISLII